MFRYTDRNGKVTDHNDGSDAFKAWATDNDGRPSDTWTAYPVQIEASPRVEESARTTEAILTDDATEARRVAAADRQSWTTEVHADDRQTAEADAATLRAMGLTPGRTLFAPGTPLVRWGLDAWQAKRDAMGDAPLVRDAAHEIAKVIEAEERRNLTVTANDIRLDVRGSDLYIVRDSTGRVGGVKVERNALAALSGSRFGRVLPSWSYVQTMTASEIANLWNSKVERTAGTNKVKIRYRNAIGGGISAYALVTPKYGIIDAHEVASILASVVPTSRGQIVYDPDNVQTTWDIQSMRNVPPVVGEVYSLYLRGSTRDDGTSSVWSGGGFLRAICVNLTTEDLKLNRKRTVHRGKRTGTTVREQIEATARALHAAFPAFGQRTEILAQTDASMLYETQHGTLREAIVAMVDSRPSLREAAAGIKRDALVQGLLINASAERDIDAPGSAADVVNAVTRYHTQRVPVPVLRAIEADAGKLAVSLAKRAAKL